MAFKFLGKNRWERSSLSCFKINLSISNEKSIAARARYPQQAALGLNIPSLESGDVGVFDAPKTGRSVCQLGNKFLHMALIQKPEWGFVSMQHCQNLATLRDIQYLQCENESSTGSMQMQILDALRFDEKTTAFDLLSHLGHSLSDGDFVHILEYCARAPNPLFAWETWKLIDERKIRLNSRSCLLLLKALCEGGDLEKGFNFLHCIGEKGGIYPFIAAYNYFLRACRKLENANLAGRCLELMENRLIGKNEATYLELLKLAVWQKNLPAVHECWNDYIKQYQINLILLRKFVWSFTRLDDLKFAYETLQIMVSIAISRSISNIRTLEERLYPSRLDVPMPSNKELSFKKCNLEDVDTLTENMGSPGNCKGQCVDFSPTDAKMESAKMDMLTRRSRLAKKVLRWSFTDVIHACAKARNCSLAEQLVQQMQNLGLEPSSHTFDGYIKAIACEKDSTDGMEVLNMMQKRNLKPYHSTIATLSIRCSKSLELDLAEELLDQISNQITKFEYTHPYNALLSACDVLNLPERAVRVLAKMKGVGIQPDSRTYELLFSLFGNVNAPYEEGTDLSHKEVGRRISAIRRVMANNGVPHSVSSVHNWLRALGKEGMIEKLLHDLVKAEKSIVYGNDPHLWTPVYNTVLYSLVKAGEIQIPRAFSIFRNMKSRDAATYTIMIYCCSIIRSLRSASALLSMMVRDGYYPQLLTYTAFIKVVLEDGKDFDEALNLLDQAGTEGIQHDVLIFNTILQKASEERRMDVVEHTIEKMHRENVRPDQLSCCYVVDAYSGAGLYSTSMEALQVLSLRMISQEDIIIREEKRKEYEELIYDEGSEAEENILERNLKEDHYHQDEDNLAFALLNLRWCAIVGGLSISWSPEQSWWSQRLSAKYDAGEGFS